MPILPAATSLHDIRNVEAFVVDCVKRSGAQARDRDEFQELICEGFVLLYKMSNDFDASRNIDGGDSFRFSGYALRYLPKKLRESWHRSHEEHLERKQPDGKRKWEFHKGAISWDEITTRDADGEQTGILDERTIRQPGNFINPPTVDAGRVRTGADE